MAFFFHLDEKAKTSEVGPNLRSVILVVNDMMVFSGFWLGISIGCLKFVKSEPDYSSSNRLTVPILLPVARYLPLLETAILVVLNAPSSSILEMHFLIFKSHYQISA